METLTRANMSLIDYAWLTGMTLCSVTSLGLGRRDHDMPGIHKVVLEYIDRYPEELNDRVRLIKQRTACEDMAIYRSMLRDGIHKLTADAIMTKECGFPQKRYSDLTYHDFEWGLREVGWTLFDFARVTGYTNGTISTAASRRRCKGISEPIKLAWEYIRRHPRDLQGRYDVQIAGRRRYYLHEAAFYRPPDPDRIPIPFAELRVKTAKLLKAHKLRYLDDLERMQRREFLTLTGASDFRYREVKLMLQRHGMRSFAMAKTGPQTHNLLADQSNPMRAFNDR